MGFMEGVDGTGSGLGDMASCRVPQRVCPRLYKMVYYRASYNIRL